MHVDLCAEPHHVVLERQLSRGAGNSRLDALVGHWQDGTAESPGCPQSSHDLVHRQAFMDEACAVDGHRQVFVAEVEPAFVAEAFQLVDDGEAVASQPPAGLRVHRPGERVDHDVRIWRNVQSEHLDVVASVRNDRHVWLRHDLDKPLEETGGANATGEHRMHGCNSRVGAGTPANACAAGGR